jgi:hypothetical protein
MYATFLRLSALAAAGWLTITLPVGDAGERAPLGVEDETGIAWRKGLLHTIGYKL